MPGDTIVAECVYDTTSRSETTLVIEFLMDLINHRHEIGTFYGPYFSKKIEKHIFAFHYDKLGKKHNCCAVARKKICANF